MAPNPASTQTATTPATAPVNPARHRAQKQDLVPFPRVPSPSLDNVVRTGKDRPVGVNPAADTAPAAEPPQIKHVHHKVTKPSTKTTTKAKTKAKPSKEASSDDEEATIKNDEKPGPVTSSSVDKHAARHAAKHTAALAKASKALNRLDPLLPINFRPKVELVVKFGTGKKAGLGKPLSLVATLTEPEILFSPAPEHDKFYTVVMVDPDMPSRLSPKLAERRLWVVSNIPGAAPPKSPSETNRDASTSPSQSPSPTSPTAAAVASIAPVAPDMYHGDVLQEYEAPAPETGTGLHHFVVLLFEQSKSMPELRCFEGNRDRWNVMRWADKNKMTLLGANFWESQDKA